MADEILQNVELTPFSPESEAALSEQFGTDKLQAKVRKGRKKLAKNIAGQAGFGRLFKKFAKTQEGEIKEQKRAAKALADVEDPVLKRQLMRSARAQIAGRRAGQAAEFGDVLGQKIAAQQLVQQANEQELSNRLAERNQARQFAAQQYLDEVNATRQQEIARQQAEFDLEMQARAFKQQMALEKEFGVGNFAPRGGGGGGGSASSTNFGTILGGKFGRAGKQGFFRQPNESGGFNFFGPDQEGNVVPITVEEFSANTGIPISDSLEGSLDEQDLEVLKSQPRFTIDTSGIPGSFNQ